MILGLHGHLGGSVISALVDGQLAGAEEERAWDHVLGCPGCRRRLEHERWVKQRLAGLGQPAVSTPDGLVGALYDVDAWASVDALERGVLSGTNRRRATTALVGAGSVGIAVMALMTITAPPAGRGEAPGRTVPASIQNGLPRPVGPRGPVAETASPGLSDDIANAVWRRTTR